MKKYFIGMLALVLAVGFSAFTTAGKSKLTNYVFSFQGTPTDDNDVKDLSLWQYEGVDQAMCSFTTQDEPCRISVTSLSYVDQTNGIPKDLTIETQAGAAGGYRKVSAVKDINSGSVVGAFTNQTLP